MTRPTQTVGFARIFFGISIAVCGAFVVPMALAQAQSHPVRSGAGITDTMRAPDTPTEQSAARATTGGPVGSATQSWLDQQRLGRYEPPAYGLNGEVATEVWKRYVKSFGREMPENFGQQVEGGKR